MECAAVMFLCVFDKAAKRSRSGSHWYNSHRIVYALQAIIRITGFFHVENRDCTHSAPHELKSTWYRIEKKKKGGKKIENETRQNTVYAVVYTCVSCDLSTESGSKCSLSTANSNENRIFLYSLVRWHHLNARTPGCQVCVRFIHPFTRFNFHLAHASRPTPIRHPPCQHRTPSHTVTV